MDIKKTVTINLSEEDVKEIISDYLNRNGYKVEKHNVRLAVGSRIEGFGMMEHSVSYFEGAYIDCNDK